MLSATGHNYFPREKETSKIVLTFPDLQFFWLAYLNHKHLSAHHAPQVRCEQHLCRCHSNTSNTWQCLNADIWSSLGENFMKKKKKKESNTLYAIYMSQLCFSFPNIIPVPQLVSLLLHKMTVISWLRFVSWKPGTVVKKNPKNWKTKAKPPTT